MRPSVVHNYKKGILDCSDDQSNQAIEGLSNESRVQVQQLCQEWWDITQEDDSVFRIALNYQSYSQEQFISQALDQFSLQEKELQSLQVKERSLCMRKAVIMQSAVIGMTAFFSMLTRQRRDSIDSVNYKQDLELRSRLS